MLARRNRPTDEICRNPRLADEKTNQKTREKNNKAERNAMNSVFISLTNESLPRLAAHKSNDRWCSRLFSFFIIIFSVRFFSVYAPHERR